MSYRIRGLEFEAFRPLVDLPERELEGRNARRVVADAATGYPDRIELRDARPGETLLLVNYEHQPARTPFRASHAILVLEHPGQSFDRVDAVPRVLRIRDLSLRAFDGQGMMVDTALCAGTEVERHIEELLDNPGVQYLHVHYAKPGCFACRVDRA